MYTPNKFSGNPVGSQPIFEDHCVTGTAFTKTNWDENRDFEEGRERQVEKFSKGPHLSFVPVSTAGGNLALAALPLPPLPELPPKILPLNQAYPGRLPELKHDSLTPSACSPRADARGHLCRFQEIMHSLWRK